MSFAWLKPYLPRGLYGRAALILILPVVTVQLVVSVLFIQRHFDGVTVQLTTNFVRELDLVLSQQDVAQRDALARALAMRITPAPLAEPVEMTLWYDLTGPMVRRELRRQVPGLRAVVLQNTRATQLYIDHRGQLLRVDIDRRRLSAPNPHQLFVNMAVFGGLMTVIAYIYLRNQLRPITRLADAAQAFGRGRVMPYRPSGATEVRAAGHAFLDMRARIERHLEQRTLMLSGVSHDLRTPLTRLKLGLSLLEDEDRAPMERDVDDMQRMLDEFLSFAKGAAEGEPEPTDPVALVRQLVEDCVREGRAVTLAEVAVDGAHGAMVPLRPLAIRRALDNLVTNAVRYGSRAEVSVALTERSLRFRVEDDGPGIPPDQRGEALRPFTRLEPARNQNAGSGVGLGLAIAADIARAHGGVLRLGESEGLGGLRADIVIAR